MKHFYNTNDFTKEELGEMIDIALQLKHGTLKKDIKGKSLAMIFFNPSLRTRVSFIMAMQKLGGLAIDIAGNYTFEFNEGTVMDKGTIEHVKEAAKVLSSYCDAIAIRSSELITSKSESVDVSSWDTLKQDIVHKKFMEFATVPVINMESNVYHPCQGLGDAMTIKEKLGNPKKKRYVLTWTYHPKALPMATPNSEILSSIDLGMDVVVAHPKGWELDPKILQTMQQRANDSGGTFAIENDMAKAMEGASIVCAKSWGALKYYGNWDNEKNEKENLKHWIVDEKKMAKTDNALFMHCLPVRRNVEVTDGVIDGKNSIVITQAENRMWAQMAILLKLLK
ncbi:MAG: N-acetylornithine carbamoyltransferase [Candidatus Levyibacteriota bacterium]